MTPSALVLHWQKHGDNIKHVCVDARAAVNAQLHNDVVAVEIVRPAVMFLSSLTAASPLKFTTQNKCRCGCGNNAFCEGGVFGGTQDEEFGAPKFRTLPPHALSLLPQRLSVCW